MIEKNNKTLVAKTLAIIRQLKKLFPEPKIALHFSNHWELLVAVMLSAQCTDKKVNEVTSHLFKKYKTIQEYANVKRSELEKDIFQTGFYRAKARHIQEAARMILEKYSGQVPSSMNSLLSLPGVGRKTANVILHGAFGINEGITVDTHVRRLACLFGLTKNTDPAKIEKDLMALVPRKDWPIISHLFILYGRQYCPARCRHTICPLREQIV